MDPPREILVRREDAGKRLDRFLAASLGLTRGYVRRLLARGRVRVEGRPTLKGLVLRAGDRIELLEFRHPDQGLRPEPTIEIPVLAEAPGCLAVDKPAGLPTHPLDFEERATVLNALLARHPQLWGVGEGGVRSGVVHRLDTATSGVLVFATRQNVWNELRSAFRERRVTKRYLARVHGWLDEERDLVLRLVHRGNHMRVVRSGGLEAVSRLRPLDRIGDTTLLEVTLVTGVRHQIRAGLAQLGHPVLGDRLYGSPLALERHLLHATSLRAPDLAADSPAPDLFWAPQPGEGARSL
ncbi:MAG: pseudouridine synthase [Myxococcota bacterium]